MLKNIRRCPSFIQVKLTDFGLACQIPPGENSIKVSPWRGTSQYRSPEQILTGEVTPASDMWSLGCCLSEMILKDTFGNNLNNYALPNKDAVENTDYDVIHVSKY